MQTENTILIGMPGCGKTTIGKRLAECSDRLFLDTDTLIVEKTGCSIPQLFAQMGESGFRNIETEAVREIAASQGVVIATGGGAVLRPENVEQLKENGRLYFLDRPLPLLTATADRPLSSTAADLVKRYEERYPIYSSVCDAKIEASATPDEVANLIREDLLYEYFGNQRT